MISDNIIKIKQRIFSACLRVNRSPDEISIVAVSKGRTVEQIKETVEAGLTNIGENRVQEAINKYNELYAKRYTLNAIKWHMVGHLQTNKAKEAVNLFDLIQSVDSLYLAKEIDKQAARINKIQDILVEVNISGEPSKFGLKPDAAIEVIKEITQLNNINIKGLMTIAPMVDNSEKTRPYFRKLRELKDQINALSTIPAKNLGGSVKYCGGDYGLSTLSMGMTDDFEVAIEEGSNMVRLGRAIFA